MEKYSTSKKSHIGNKVVAYIRVSTDEQKKKGYGLEIQINEIAEYIIQKDLEFLEIFKDEGVSGANDITKRKGLHDLLNYCKNNHVENVIITKMDRLARDMYIQLWIEKELLIHNITIISIGEDNLNGNDTMTIAMRQMVGVFAQLEKNRISERLLSGRRMKASKGIKSNGNCPFGYKYEYDEQGKNPIVIVDDEKANIVKQIFNMYINFHSLQKIVNYLNENNIKTKKGNQWSKQTLKYVLNNDIYIGIIRFDDIVEIGKHSCIINKDDFSKVQNMLKDKRNNKTKSII